LGEFFFLYKTCAVAEAGVAGLGVCHSSWRDRVGLIISFSKKEDDSFVFEYWRVSGICILDNEHLFIHQQAFLALSCTVAESDMDAEDADFIGARVDGIYRNCIVDARNA